MLEGALALARRGWFVFPCRPSAKTPAVENGFLQATRDEQKITDWWTGRRGWADRNPSIATGQKSGVWVLDVDPGRDGEESLMALIEAHGDLPVTLMARTRSGGVHYYFLWDGRCDPETVRNRANFASGLDVRGEGGYVLCAPSRVSEKGTEGGYSWLNDAAVSPAPDWLLDLIIRHVTPVEDRPPRRKIERSGNMDRYGETVLKAECEKIAGCPPGAQDETLVRSATRIGSIAYGGHVDVEYARACAIDAGLSMANGDQRNPWTRSVIERKVNRAFEHASHDPYTAKSRSGGGPGSIPFAQRGGGKSADPERPKPQLVVDNSEKVEPEPVQASAVLTENWAANLPWVWKDQDTLKPAALRNVALMLEHHPMTRGMFVYDAFRDQMNVTRGLPDHDVGPYPREMEDHDEAAVATWMNDVGLTPAIKTMADVIRMVATKSGFNPMNEWLDGLVWDGKERIDTWLIDYAKAEDSDYSRIVGRKFLTSAIARARNPGCKVDTMLILEGPQGYRKSSLVRALAGEEWFGDQLGDITSKDSSQVIQSFWVLEVPEMDKMSRHETDVVKEYISRQTDTYRPAYGRNVKKRGRRCVFIGTINPNGNGYIKDPTGGRRFWPVTCLDKCDTEGVSWVRDQLWAEALAAYDTGESWWLTDNEECLAEIEQEKRQQDDLWEPKIEEWLRDLKARGHEEFQLSDLINDALRIEVGKQSQREKLRVTNVLTSLKCERSSGRVDGRKVRMWNLGGFK